MNKKMGFVLNVGVLCQWHCQCSVFLSLCCVSCSWMEHWTGRALKQSVELDQRGGEGGGGKRRSKSLCFSPTSGAIYRRTGSLSVHRKETHICSCFTWSGRRLPHLTVCSHWATHAGLSPTDTAPQFSGEWITIRCTGKHCWLSSTGKLMTLWPVRQLRGRARWWCHIEKSFSARLTLFIIVG